MNGKINLEDQIIYPLDEYFYQKVKMKFFGVVRVCISYFTDNYFKKYIYLYLLFDFFLIILKLLIIKKFKNYKKRNKKLLSTFIS